MISKNKQKLISSLAQKKHRDKNALFIAEGNKIVLDLLQTSLKLEELWATEEWISKNQTIIQSNSSINECTVNELKKVSQHKSPPAVIACFAQKDHQLNIEELAGKLSLFLDDIQDPGNLGTIIRIADWFGIENIICSKGCADCYNSKTIQSTMGAIARVNIHYLDSASFFSNIKPLNLPIYGTFLDGNNIYHEELTSNGIIVMGNEGNGINPSLEAFINQRLLIPNYPTNSETSESLNVSVATAITCAEFRRRAF